MKRQPEINKDKILIVSDIHQEIGMLERIIEKEKPDFTYFLGDFFDSHFKNSLEDTKRTAAWLKNNLYRDNYFFLRSNHDVPYTIWNNVYFCSGYTREKKKLINSILTFQDWEQFRLHYWLGDILLTHAGYCKFLPGADLEGDKFKKWLKEQELKAIDDWKMFKAHWLLECGEGRDGQAAFGGITWCDFNQEFSGIKGLSQIFGHTYSEGGIRLVKSGEWKRNFVNDYEMPINKVENSNFCIDSNLSFYMLIEQGVLKVGRYSDC